MPGNASGNRAIYTEEVLTFGIRVASPALWLRGPYSAAQPLGLIGVIAMNLSLPFRRFLVVLCLPVLGIAVTSAVALPDSAQPAASTKTAPGTYNIANDVSLQGTILSYTENSQTPPIGTHLVLQTSSGNAEVHLGDARLLHLAKLNLAQGMSIRVVGQMQTVGAKPVFMARLVQSGAQVLAVRSVHGLPLAAGALRANKALVKNVPADQQGGAR